MRLAFREALRSFRRAPLLSALSVTTIAFAIFVVGLFGLVALNLNRALREVEKRVEVVAYLMRGTPVEVVTVAIGDVERFPEVADVTYVTEDQALARAQKELVELQGVFDDLVSNPLPASLEVRLKPGFRDSDHLRDVAERLRGFRFVEDVRYGRDWVIKLDRIRDLTAIGMLVIGGAFAAASVVIIGTTIRMAVFQRSREIAIMRLVGATDGFIRLPFLLEGSLKGALGGTFALGLTYVAYVAFDRMLLRAQFFNPAEAVVFVVFGFALGFSASLAAVSRHLKSVRPA
ncbi:MAG: ABC transporter permease [Gemmatimonadetes bacterium]|nr:ABC transporter permease [Gemmatimonadota bacterium]